MGRRFAIGLGSTCLLAALAVYGWYHFQMSTVSSQTRAFATADRETPPAVPTPADAPTTSEAAHPALQVAPSAAHDESTLKIRKFRALVRESLAALPSKAEIHRLKGEEIHDTPEMLQNAGTVIGHIAEAIALDPSLASEGRKFYEACALNADKDDVVRALCYVKLRRLLKSRGESLRDFKDDGDIPDSVRDLADKLD